MSDIVVPNYALAAANNAFSALFELSRAMKKAGWIYKASADGSAKDTTGVATNDKWGGNADPLADAYPTALNSVAAWWCAQGPTTLKLVINTAPTGTFQRGEKITQATSGAEGELIGYDFDGSLNNTTVAAGSNGVNISTFAGAGTLNVASTTGFPTVGSVALPALSAIISYTGVGLTSFTGCTTVSGSGVLATGQVVNGATGHAVVLPRTGTFNNSNVVTGAISGATFTPVGLKTLVREVVLFKSTDLVTGSMYVQCIINEDENASRFSVLAGSAGCTATVAPGGGGSGNAMPTAGTYVNCGSQNAGTPTHSNWFNSATNLGRAQVVATNCTGAANISPDGSFWILQGDASSATQAQLIGFFRCDDTEDGDLDPFISFKVSNIAPTNANVRTDATGTAPIVQLTAAILQGSTTQNTTWRAWRRRGFPSGDAFQAMLTIGQFIGSTATFTLGDNNSNPETIANSYATKRLRERVQLMSCDNTKKMRKGSVRWIWAMQAGTTFDTIDGKLKVLITPSASNVPSYSTGPYDGASTPLQ